MNAPIKTERNRKGFVTGLFIIGLGVLWLLSEMGLRIPRWLFSWEMILIAIGTFIGISSNFRKPASYILIAVGLFFMLDDLYIIPWEIREYLWPVLVIIVGVIVLVRPGKNRYVTVDPDNPNDPTAKYHVGDVEMDPADRLDTVSIFNGIKKNILSKNFVGGETVSIFGGTELDLSRADFSKPITIESVVIFGGLKLIVPPNWEVRTNVVSIFAGVEDKRVSSIQVVPDDKILIITGVTIFGGIDIVSF